MSKRNEIIAGLFGIWFLCGIAAYATEVDTMGNLTDTSAKISSIDMDKNPDDTGKILDVFYSGAKTKEETSSPVVFAGTGNREASEQTGKEVCNAKPSKISLTGKVPPLTLLHDVKYTWHGPNPNPSNDPIIENGMNQHYQNWCDIIQDQMLAIQATPTPLRIIPTPTTTPTRLFTVPQTRQHA